MNWQSFISKLEKDFRISPSELEERTGVHRSIYFRLKSGKTRKPKQDTVKKLEEGLQIKIDDSDPLNIFYIQNLHDANIELFTITGNEFPIISEILPLTDILNPSNITGKITLPYPFKNNCCAIQPGQNPRGSKNDRMLIDITMQPEEGNLCAVKTCSGEQFIKYLRVLPEELYQFYEKKCQDEPLTLKKDSLAAIYKVVLAVNYL